MSFDNHSFDNSFGENNSLFDDCLVPYYIKVNQVPGGGKKTAASHSYTSYTQQHPAHVVPSIEEELQIVEHTYKRLIQDNKTNNYMPESGEYDN